MLKPGTEILPILLLGEASMTDKMKKERGEVGGNSLICMEQEERRCWLLSVEQQQVEEVA